MLKGSTQSAERRSANGVAIPSDRPPESDAASPRINKYLAACGVCSRREADRLVDEGRVLIDGRRAVSGDRVSPGTEVSVDGTPVHPQERRVVFAYYKPRGVVCTERDPHAQRTVLSEIKDRRELKQSGISNLRLIYIGRLDKDSEGLLLLTNDGMLKRKLESAGSGSEKEYLVTTDRPLSKEAARRMEQGVFLEELGLKTRPCTIRTEGETSFFITLTEGKNRQIRRMCETEGLKVLRLIRVRECGVLLGGMRPGDLREITEEEQHSVDTVRKNI